MTLRGLIVAALGLGLAVYVALHLGFGAVLSATAAAGWEGFALICLYALLLYPLLGAAWALLLPGARHSLLSFIWARMVREAAADVLPFSQLGGIVIGARSAMRHGLSAPRAFASTIVDVTTEVLAQIVFIALGLAILGGQASRSASEATLTAAATTGVALLAAAGAALLLIQRYGHRMMSRLASRLVPRTAASADAVVDCLDDIYRSRTRVAASSALHLAGWIASAGGTWIAFRLIGQRIDFASSLVIESLMCAAKSSAAFVPNALGVQEAGYAALAPLFGIAPQFGLAVSLLKRGRDIALGAPILLAAHGLPVRRSWRGA